jgi:hypothetical protein
VFEHRLEFLPLLTERHSGNIREFSETRLSDFLVTLPSSLIDASSGNAGWSTAVPETGFGRFSGQLQGALAHFS